MTAKLTDKYNNKMVLFEFDTIIKDRFQDYITNNPENTSNKNEYEKFYHTAIEQMTDIFPFYFTKINPNYIYPISLDMKNKIIFSCIDNNFNLTNITSILIYRKTKSAGQIKYYVLVLGTHERFRKFGYGKIIIDEFVQWIKQTDKSVFPKKILLKSLDTSLGFYQSYGFEIAELKNNKLFYKYEMANELKSNKEKILEFVIK